MPNWTFNEVSCKKYIADKMLTKKDGKYIFDFNKLIKMPKELSIECSSSGEAGLMYLYAICDNKREKAIINKAYKSCNMFFSDIQKSKRYKSMKKDLKSFEKTDDFKKCVKLGKSYLDNYKKYGYCNWYLWCVENWGTKWNINEEVSVESTGDKYRISFDTAWSVPYEIAKKCFSFCKSDKDLYWDYENEDFDGYHHLYLKDGVIKDRVSNKYIDYER